jgi:pyrroline-5-carboxylate reductase
MNTFGFIGTGNMGGALARAVAKSVAPENMYLSDAFPEKAAALANELGCKSVSAEAVAKNCDFIFLGVKPQVMSSMLQSIAPTLNSRTENFVLVSMAAGVEIFSLQRMIDCECPIIRIMPNIPASVGEGVILFDATENVSQEALAAFRTAMAGAGLVSPLPEKLIDAGSALSGCGPAFVSLFIEALADGAVACGLPRQQAMEYACQTLIGTAKMLQSTGIHPGALKDAVCSPGGSTIAGVNALEQNGFRGAVAEAVISAYERTCELGK